MMHVSIITPSGKQKVKLQEKNSIGRHPSNLISIADPSVSKNHCLLTMDRNGICNIEDLSSTNGTYVNQKRIRERTKVYIGDEIRLGNILIILEGDDKIVSQMVEMTDGTEGPFSSTMYPQQQTRFLPEEQIYNGKDLRADYEKLRVTYELENEMNLERDISKTLDRILARTFEFLKCDQGVILLADQKGTMVPHSYKTRRGNEKLTVSSTLVKYVQEKKTGVISTDIPSDNRFNIAESIMIEGVKSTMAAPMMFEEEILGIMILYSLEMIYAFSSKDLGLITAIANQAARIIKNAKLHEELRLSFDSSIRTLSATVDARHPLTAGHSARVSEISIMIGERMHLPQQMIRILKFATLMHDIGKIAIPDEILLKNGRFSPTEKAIMDLHPAKTKEILENFYFPESLENVPLIAGSHHEKMDGSGYPLGLKDQEIPLASRIIAVADVFDALTSKRDYPKYIDNKTISYDALPVKAVVAIIREGSGPCFDENVVAAFMECLPDISKRLPACHAGAGD